MQAIDLLTELHHSGADVHIIDGENIRVLGNLTNEHRKAIRTLKPELLRLLAQEERRNRVLQLMAMRHSR